MLGAGLGFVAGFASGWMTRGQVDSSRAAVVAIVATYFKSVERVKRIVAIEREHLEDLVAEGRAKFELDRARVRAATQIPRESAQVLSPRERAA
jgi:hypothetical protein